eukprot:2731182-Rhodomonas_salina.1
MHDGLTQVSNIAESWNPKVQTMVEHAGMHEGPLLPLPKRNHNVAPDSAPLGAAEVASDGFNDPVRIDPNTGSVVEPKNAQSQSAQHRFRRGSVEGNAYALPRGKHKRSSLGFLARRFSTASSVQMPPASPADSGLIGGASRAGSVVGAKRGSMVAVH